MRASQASRQLGASKVLDLFLASDRTRARIVRNHQIGGTTPVAAPSPEAANNGSGRGAVVICLGAPALSKTSDNVPRQIAERDRRALSEIPFHDAPANPEALG